MPGLLFLQVRRNLGPEVLGLKFSKLLTQQIVILLGDSKLLFTEGRRLKQGLIVFRQFIT